MTQRSWPYPDDSVTVAEWPRMARLFRETGVVETVGGALEVSPAGSELAVDVASGDAFVDGFYYESTEVERVQLPDASLNDPRVDLIVVQSDLQAGHARLEVIVGTPGEGRPDVVQDTDGQDRYDLVLAEVQVPTAAGTPGTVTDERRFSEVTGGVTFVDDQAERDALDNLYPGRVVFREDSGSFEVYDGDTWRTSTPADGIPEVGGSIRGYREPGLMLPTSGTVTLDLSEHNLFTIDPAGDVAFEFDGLPPAGVHASASIIVLNDGHEIAWPSGTQHPDDGAPPVLTGKTYLSVFVEYDGTVVVARSRGSIA